MARIVPSLPTTCPAHSTLYTIISSMSASLLLLGVEDASIMYIATCRVEWGGDGGAGGSLWEDEGRIKEK